MNRVRLRKRRVSANHLFFLDKLASSFRPGEFASIFKGDGNQFLGLRPYEPGDRPGNIDWAKSATSFYSTGQLMVQERMERRKLSVIFVVDISFSEIVGKQVSKFSQNSFFVELLTDYCLKEGVEVGYILFGKKIFKFIPPPASKKGVERAVELIKKPKAGKKTDLLQPLRKLIGLRRASVVFLISDFITEFNWKKAMSRCQKAHVVVPIVLVDDLDLSIRKALGAVMVRGIESEEYRLTDGRTQDNSSYLLGLRNYFKKSGIKSFFVGKSGDEETWFKILTKIFNEIREEKRR